MEAVNNKFRLGKVKLPADDDPRYEILSSDTIKKEIAKLAEEVKEVIENVSIETCYKLLHEFKWDYAVLLEKYYEADSFDQFLKRVKISVSVQLSAEELLQSFIQANELMKWCPNKVYGCMNAVKVDTSDVQDVVCECGLTYCFYCEATPHSPFPCVIVQEWVAQVHDFKRIFKDNNVVCPHCYEFYDAQHAELFCIRCDNMFLQSVNRLRLSAYPEYKDHVTLSKRLEKLHLNRDALIGVQGAEFMSIVCEIAERYLHKILPLPAFSFYLDKEYLCKNDSTVNNVSMFEYYYQQLKHQLEKLMNLIDSKCGNRTLLVSKDDEQEILIVLYSLQMHSDVLFTFIVEEKGWIFKLPEIQDAYGMDNNNAMLVLHMADVMMSSVDVCN